MRPFHGFEDLVLILHQLVRYLTWAFGFQKTVIHFFLGTIPSASAGCALVGFGVGLLVTWNSLHWEISWNMQCVKCNIMQVGRILQYRVANLQPVQMQLQDCMWNFDAMRVKRVFLLMVQMQLQDWNILEYWNIARRVKRVYLLMVQMQEKHGWGRRGITGHVSSLPDGAAPLHCL